MGIKSISSPLGFTAWWQLARQCPVGFNNDPSFATVCGKWIHQHSYGKSPFFMGKSTINIYKSPFSSIFNSYVTNYQRVHVCVWLSACRSYRFWNRTIEHIWTCVCVFSCEDIWTIEPELKWPWVTGFLIAKLGDHGKLRGEVFQVVALFLHVALRNEPATAPRCVVRPWELRKLDGKKPWCVLSTPVQQSLWMLPVVICLTAP